MRITVHLPAGIERGLREAASEEKISVSAFVAKAVRTVLESRTKRKYGEQVLALAGRARVSPGVLHELERERAGDDRT